MRERDDGPTGTGTPAEVIDRAAALTGTDPERAVELVSGLLTPAVRRTDPATSARARLILAEARVEQGRHSEAVAAARAARRDFLAAGLFQESHQPALVWAEALHLLGDHERAIEVAAGLHDPLAAGAETSPGPPDARTRAGAHLVRACSLSRLGDHNRALHHFDLAWDQFAALGEVAQQARTEFQRGTAYLRLDMVRRALSDLRNAHDSFLELGLENRAARCAVAIAEALLRLESPRPALQHLTAAEEHFARHGPAVDLARVKLAQGNVLFHAGMCHDAHAVAEEAVELLFDLDQVEELAQALLVAGLCSIGMEDHVTARTEFGMADRILTAGHDPQLRAQILLAGAWLAQREEDHAQARDLANACLASEPSDTLRTSAELLLASASTSPSEGWTHLDRVTQRLAAGDTHPLWLAHAGASGRLHRLDGDPEEARQVLVRALRDRIDGSAGQQHVGPHSALLAALVIDELLETLLTLGDPASLAQAWQWATMSRTVRVGGSVTGQRLLDREETDGARDQILDDLSDAFDQLNDPDASPDTDAVRRAQRAASRTLRHRLVRTHAARNDLPPIPEGPVLQFHVLGADVICFVIREGQVYAHRLEGAAPLAARHLDDWAVECSRMTHLGRRDRTGTEHDTEPLHLLAALLLDPVMDLLDDLRHEPRADPLVVVGHRHLNRVPFEALPTLDGTAFGHTHRLVFVHEPFTSAGSDSPSASVEPPGESLLVLAVPDLRAPRITREAEMIAELRPTATVAVGSRATTDLLAREARHHGLVHIAAHGMWDPLHPLRSALRLGDRWITAAEVLELDLTGSTVVLNACATGQGWETASEAGGLVWAFLAAGCRGVVSTLWPVDDDTAAEFARLLHARLAAGDDPADAVPAATRSLAEQFHHPWHWAAFRHTAQR